MNPDKFLASMETALRDQLVPFSRAALIAFIESSWEVIDDHPYVAFWCERFLELGAAVEVPC
jgi:hypothetical protein